MKTVDVSTEIMIERPLAVVASFASNPDNATTWYANIKSVEWKTERPLAIGTQIAFTAQFLGKRLAYTYEVVELIPNEKFVMRTANGPFPMETTYRWERISETETRMTLRNRGIPTGFVKIFAPFMAAAMRKANLKDLKRIKRVLEKK
jgi:uncharacterized membrane protein